MSLEILVGYDSHVAMLRQEQDKAKDLQARIDEALNELTTLAHARFYFRSHSEGLDPDCQICRIESILRGR